MENNPLGHFIDKKKKKLFMAFSVSQEKISAWMLHYKNKWHDKQFQQRKKIVFFLSAIGFFLFKLKKKNK